MRSWGWTAGTTLLAAALTAGCSTVASKDVRTSGMIAHISVAATTSGARVSADLSAGGTTSVELGPGDQLMARSGGKQVSLRESSFLGLHSYGATLPVRTGPGTTVTVQLSRTADDQPATSSVRLPGPVGLRAPKDGAKVSRSKDLRVLVAPGAGAIRVDWKGSCVGGGEVRFEEGRPAVLPAGSMRPAAPASGQSTPPAPPAPPDRCDVALTVTRVLDGRLGSSYKSGVIESLRSQSIVVRTVP